MNPLQDRANAPVLPIARRAVVIACAILLWTFPYRGVLAQAPPELDTAGGFAVLGGTTVTCTSSTIIGDVGVYSGAVEGCAVLGTIHEGNPVARQAYSDAAAAYDLLAVRPCDLVLVGSLAGVTLTPGVYCFAATAAVTGVLTLSGPSDGVWIFKIGTSGTGALQATDFQVMLSGGTGCTERVYWWTAQAASLTDSRFFGRVLAGTDFTATRGNLNGQALAKGAVTLTATAVSLDFCPVREVSPSYAAFSARLTADAISPTGFYLYFERLDGVDGYNIYEGTVGTWYGHGTGAGTLCNAPATDLGTGEMRAVLAPSGGDHYFLVTAYAGGREGPSGFATYHREIDPLQSRCAP